jgi:CelD/BcsL family acetyltransferase involved in cellulose biosynthesis
VRVELTDDPTVFRRHDWTDVVLADPTGTFFHTPAYLKLWWEEFGTGSLIVARAVEEGRTVGACAFEVTGGSLAFLGGFDVTDYMGPAAMPGVEGTVAKEILAALVSDASWTRADLRGLPLDSPWLVALEQAFQAQGMRTGRADDDVAPMIALPRSYEAYLAAMPSKLRHEMRRKPRRLSEAAGPYRIRLATAGSLPEDFTRFMDLHRSSPGPKGKFMHAGMEIFFRRLGEAFLEPHVFHLAFLEVGNREAAGAIGFAFKNTFSLYNSAFDREFSPLAPGMVLVGDLIRRAIELGRGTFDLLKGDLEYKYRFGSVPRPIGALRLER